MGHSKVPHSWCDNVLSLLLYSLSDAPPLKLGSLWQSINVISIQRDILRLAPPPKTGVKSFALPSITTTKVYT